MSAFVLKNQELYAGHVRLHPLLNSVECTVEREAQDATTFGAATTHSMPGLKSNTLSGDGLWDTVLDGDFFALLGGTKAVATGDDIPVTLLPYDGVDGDKAYFMNALHTSYSASGKVGDIFAFKFKAEQGSSGDLVGGQIMKDFAATAITGTAAGTAFQTGAVSATQTMWAVMHIFAVSGTSPTLAMVVQSDDAVGMASPTARITFTTVTGTTGPNGNGPVSQLTSLAGPVTDDWWRASWTVGGSNSPTFYGVVVIGIV